jgi:hypothetical protein
VQHCYILNARLLRPQFPFPERRRIAKAFTPDCILPRDSKPGRRLDGLRGDTGALSALGLGWGASREIRCQLRDNKLLEDIGDSRFSNPDQCVREH